MKCVGVRIGNATYFVNEKQIEEAGSKEEAANRLKEELFHEPEIIPEKEPIKQTKKSDNK